MNQDYRINRLKQEKLGLELSLEQRELLLARANDRIKELERNIAVRDLTIEGQRVKLLQLEATQHHPGCGKYIRHLIAQLNRTEEKLLEAYKDTQP